MNCIDYNCINNIIQIEFIPESPKRTKLNYILHCSIVQFLTMAIEFVEYAVNNTKTLANNSLN